MRGICYSEEQG